jgi:hypothetical protein
VDDNEITRLGKHFYRSASFSDHPSVVAVFNHRPIILIILDLYYMSVETLSSVHLLLHVERKGENDECSNPINSASSNTTIQMEMHGFMHIRPATRSTWEYEEFNVFHFEIKYLRYGMWEPKLYQR